MRRPVELLMLCIILHALVSTSLARSFKGMCQEILQSGVLLRQCGECDKTRNPNMYFTDPCRCGIYYQCQPSINGGVHGTGYTVHPRWCPPCMCFDQDLLTCVPDPDNECPITIGKPINEIVISVGRVCMAMSFSAMYAQPFAADLTDSRNYYMLSWGTPVKMPCPSGTTFETRRCKCTFGGPLRLPSPFMCMTFDGEEPLSSSSGLYLDAHNVVIDNGAGVVGNAASFDGTANIEIPAFSNKESYRFSLSLFFKRAMNGPSGLQALLSNDDCNNESHNAAIQVLSSSASSLGGGYRTTRDDVIQAFNGIQAEAGSWHHVVMTYNGREVTLYVNGTRRVTVPASGPIKAVNCPLRVGALYDGGNFVGLMDQVCFYDYALSVNQVNNLFQNPSDVQYPSNTYIGNNWDGSSEEAF